MTVADIDTAIERLTRFANWVLPVADLDEAPARAVRTARGDLVLNPFAMSLRRGGQTSVTKAGAVIGHIEAPDLLGVLDTGIDLFEAFRCGETDGEWLAELSAGRRCATDVPETLRHRLMRAGILIERDSRAGHLWRVPSQAAVSLRNTGLARLPGLLMRRTAVSLRDYVRSLAHKGGMSPCGQVAGRMAAYNDPVMNWLHISLVPAIEQLTGREVKPSYTYLATYPRGSELQRHLDRAQCEWTLSVALDVLPEDASTDSWPLMVAHADGVPAARIAAGLGDGAIFCGRTMPHWRERLRSAKPQTFVFLHYVPVEFGGELG